MSTRSTVWYQDEDEFLPHFHVYRELAEEGSPLCLEIDGGNGFVFIGEIPKELADAILAGLPIVRPRAAR